MKDILNFLIKIHKLKETVRTGWKIWRISNPETIAEHIFRVSFLAFLLAKKKSLRLKISLQNAISHDLCEVYAGDITPVFYYQNLDVAKKKDREILFKGIRLPEKSKIKYTRLKVRRERKSLLKLVNKLEPSLGKEIFLRWSDYENGITPEGRFIKQIDWIENLIQSLEYLGPEGSGSGWWEIAEEKVYDPLLLDSLRVIQKKFYGSAHNYKQNRELEDILDFILQVGKLKRMPRLYWALRGIKNPETVAGHIFTLATMAWAFGKKKKGLNQEKLLKMALCHQLPAIETGDTTPYDQILSGGEPEKKRALEKMIRLSREEKRRIFLEDYNKEKRALERITQDLSPSLRKEMIDLWEDYKNKRSKEAYFLNQLNTLAILLQGLLYEKKYKHFSAKPLWEWAFEVCDDPLLISFMEEMKKRFHIRYFIRDFLLEKFRPKK